MSLAAADQAIAVAPSSCLVGTSRQPSEVPHVLRAVFQHAHVRAWAAQKFALDIAVREIVVLTSLFVFSNGNNIKLWKR
jgi:hypothetical protein